eukprot:14195827-Alexandrium_andersonii.AAC.1
MVEGMPSSPLPRVGGRFRMACCSWVCVGMLDGVGVGVAMRAGAVECESCASAWNVVFVAL